MSTTHRERFERVGARDEKREKDLFRPRKSDQTAQKKRAKSSDDVFEATYKEGVKEGKREASEKQKRLKARKRKYPVARKVAKRATRPVTSGVNQGLRQLEGPVQAQVAGAVKLSGLTLAVVGLYLFLQNATAVSGVLGSLSRGLAWLQAPDRAVPYVKSNEG